MFILNEPLYMKFKVAPCMWMAFPTIDSESKQNKLKVPVV